MSSVEPSHYDVIYPCSGLLSDILAQDIFTVMSGPVIGAHAVRTLANWIVMCGFVGLVFLDGCLDCWVVVGSGLVCGCFVVLVVAWSVGCLSAWLHCWWFGLLVS